MNITIEKNTLIESIQYVSKAITQRSTIPILSGIKIYATENGITLTASDTEITIENEISINESKLIQVYESGAAVLPSKFFIEIVKKLPHSTISIQTNEHFEATIISGATTIQMMGLDPDEYPVITKLEKKHHTLQMPSQLLKNIIKQITFAVSTNEATPVLTGVLCQFNENEFMFTACDRHRLAKRKIIMHTEHSIQPFQIVIPGRTLNELNKILLDNQSPVSMTVNDNQILFYLEEKSVYFYSALLSGTYPDTSKLIPHSFSTKLSINHQIYTDAIERAYLLSREDKTNIVKLNMNENYTIEVSSISQKLGKIKEELDQLSLDGEMLMISFNSKYMLEALKVIESEEVFLGFTGNMQPIIIKPENDEDLIQLILPYRTT